MATTQAPRSKKYRHIVETAEELFFKHSVKRVSVEEICKKANVSKMTFYRYFSNKQELAEHIIRLMFEQSYAKLDDVEALEIPFTAKLQMLLDFKLEFVEKMSSEYIREYMHLIQGTMMQQWMQRVMRFMRHAQERGDIRADVRPELIILMLDKYSELVDDQRIAQLYPDYTELTKDAWRLFYYGVLPRKDEA